MERKYTNRRYLDSIGKKILIYDGAAGTNFQAMNLSVEHFGGQQYYGCNDYLNLSYPQAVEKLHRSFLDVGVDVIETNTFRSNRITMAEYGLQERVMEINRAAAKLARRLADDFSDSKWQRFVAGSIGPTGKLPSAIEADLTISFDELRDVFKEQAIGLIYGDVDVILLETMQDLLEVKAALHGIREAFSETGIYLPIQAQVTLDTNGRMLLGSDISAVLASLEGTGIDVIGLNCSTGPEHMRGAVEFLSKHSRLPISVIPNAGLPLNRDGVAYYPLEPTPFAEALTDFVRKYRINVVGGCCGTTPEHLRLLVEKLRDEVYIPRVVHFIPQLSSSIQAVDMHQQPPPFIIGERCNAQGSKTFKDILLNEEFDRVIEVAQAQMAGGAHALDVSVAVTERADEVYLMQQVVRKLVASGIALPLVIDTTEPEVMEAALKLAPGRCMLNSTHLEGGRAKADRVFSLAKRYNAVVIALTIDERGMAKEVERKVEVANRLYSIGVGEHGLAPQDLVFDALTFTLASGDAEFADSAVQTIEGIRQIKRELPGVFTSLGISNVSFGLSRLSRPVLNSVFLYHCVQAGLDMAIVSPGQIIPYAEISREERQLAENLIFNREADALQRFIEYFENNARASIGNKIANVMSTLTPEERLHYRILHRHKEGLEADIDEIINRGDFSTPHQCAVNILNEILLPAMKEVGDKFGSGELILPFVLQSAEVMKKAVSHLENYLEKTAETSKGTLVLATVYGDVHDIGKNLVKTIIANNGYRVVDLGKQVPVEAIISASVEAKADAIGLSALLVSTSKQMPLVVNELARRNLKIPVLIGGAAINRRFGLRVLFTDSGEAYEPGVFYCKDAFEGLYTLDKLVNLEEASNLKNALISQAKQEILRADQVEKINEPANVDLEHRQGELVPSSTKWRVPQPPFWGARVLKDISCEEVFKYLPKRDLFRLSWGAKNLQGDTWLKLEAEFEQRLQSMIRDVIQGGWLKPQAAYGYWPAQAWGDQLILYDPNTIDSLSPKEVARFTFPRQKGKGGRCLADYFAPLQSGVMDVVALQVVTVGEQATAHFDELQALNNYSEAFYFHGLATQMAEATAEFVHRKICEELEIPVGQGRRYSWGYPAIPDLTDHRKVFDLLPAEKELGMSLTAAYQLIPEQSTAAIVVHHPKAVYYSVGESRLDMLTSD